MMEKRPIPCNPRYKADRMGTIYSLRGLPMSQHRDRNGYMRLVLSHGGKSKNHRVHRLVAEAFLGPLPDGMQVNHKDGDKGNNRLSNLEYVTASENIKHAFKSGLRVPTSGRKHRMSRLCADDIITIRRRRKSGETYSVIASDYGVAYQHVHGICSGRFWKHIPEGE